MSLTFQPTLTGHSHLRGLVMLRSISIAGQCATLALVHQVLNMQLAWAPMLATIGALSVINIATWWRLRGNRPVSVAELFLQLCIDVLALSILLYFSGGSTNPFVSLYLLPLVIAAATLPRLHTWIMAALTIGCYSLLMLWYIPLPGMNGHAHQHDNAPTALDNNGLIHSLNDFCITQPVETLPTLISLDSDFNTHVLGMWLGFVISAAVIAYFVVRMAHAVRERDEALARAREETLRNERIVDLGMQAAGAAHEMGTPLSTMLVVVGELKHETGALPDWQHSLDVLEKQIRGCKQILDKMLAHAKDGEQQVNLAQFMSDTLSEWQLLRPAARYNYQADNLQSVAPQRIDPALRAALLNLLNNAADSSPQQIDIHARCSATHFILEINDYGSGISAEQSARIGTAWFTTKQEGRGLGLFLANATLERLGGKVRLYNRFNGGATTEVTLPLEIPA